MSVLFLVEAFMLQMDKWTSERANGLNGCEIHFRVLQLINKSLEIHLLVILCQKYVSKTTNDSEYNASSVRDKLHFHFHFHLVFDFNIYITCLFNVMNMKNRVWFIKFRSHKFQNLYNFIQLIMSIEHWVGGLGWWWFVWRIAYVCFYFRSSYKEDKRVQVAAIKSNKLEHYDVFSQEVDKFNFPSSWHHHHQSRAWNSCVLILIEGVYSVW